MAYTKYSLTPANNNAAPPDGAPEGMLPSAVNDTMRDMMAQIRDVGDGIRDGTYTMTAPKITGGTITGAAFTGNTFTSPVISGGTINNATIGATTATTGKFTAVTNSALTSGRVTYAGTAGVLQDDADFTFNGTTVTMANDASISGLTVGKGGGAVSSNTAFGVNALTANEAGGTNNTAIGNAALDSNTTGDGNTAVGDNALQANTTASNNTAVGWQSAYLNTTGTELAAFGVQALYSNTTGNYNTAIGGRDSATYAPLLSNTTGSNNTAIGNAALAKNTTASFNTATGYQAGYSNTTGDICAFGAFALTSNTTGVGNVALGGYGNGTGLYAALQLNTTGSRNTAVGNAALQGNTTGTDNTAVGYQSLYSNTTGFQNTSLGEKAGYSNTTESYSTYIGYGSGESTTGAQNTFVGSNAGNSITSGAKNSIIGRYNGNQGGLDIRTSSNRIVISDGDGNPRQYINNNGQVAWGTTSIDGYLTLTWAGQTYVGFVMNNTDAFGTSANIRFKNNGTLVGEISSSTTATNYVTSSDYRLKENVAPMTGALTKVAQLKPCTYTWKSTGEASQGFIAHELQAVVPDCVTGEKDALNEDGSIKPQGIDTSFLVATLTAAIQEQQAIITDLKARIEILENK
jgi:trimeric autotransporter adhesin